MWRSRIKNAQLQNARPEEDVLDESHIATRTWRVTPDLMCILDGEGRFLAVNPAWSDTLGWPREQIVGRPYLDFLHPDDVDASNRAFAQVKSGRPVLRFENRYRKKEGGYCWLSWVAVPEGKHFYCTIRNVTDQKEREQTITDQREEAELREQFLAVLGHDLKNPVTSVVSGLRLLSREPQSDQAADAIRAMQSSCARMSELITNMMDFARARLGDGIGLDRRRHGDLGAQLRDVIGELQNVFPDARIEFDEALERPVDCDANRIMQVLSNLLGNAVTHGAPNESIRISADQTGDRFKLRVCNGGAAIPDEARASLFQPFFKGDPRSSPQGLGLGLYICAQIAEAHGGALKATSDEVETCFELDIPG